ncbi:MAG: LysR family transcriptional regulator [Rhodomicrobium sp.]
MTSIADLEIFARVVTAGSMSAAGRELDLSPAVVSKRISHLEGRLGTRLFHRTTRQLQLTETGRGFYERVVQILAKVQEAEAFVSSGHESAGGMLKVTVPTSFSRLHVAPYIGRFREQHPGLELEIIVTDQILDIVREGIDVAVRVSELDDSSLVAKKLAPCRKVFCASPEYLKKHGTPKTLAELGEHNVIAENSLPWGLQGPDGVSSLRPSSEVRTNSSDIALQAVISGAGLGFRPTYEIRDELLTKRLVHILPQYREAPSAAVYAVYPDKQFIPARLRVFVDFLMAAYGSAPYWDEGLELGARAASSKKHVQPASEATA